MSLPVIQEEARKCSGCLEWHKHCGAECCSTMMFSGPAAKARLYKGQHVKFTVGEVSEDLKFWYDLHGARVEGNTIHVQLKEFTKKNGVIIVRAPCRNLTEDLRCKEWASGNRPEHCKKLTRETAGDMRKHLTPNCLFKYQLENETD